MASLIYKYKNPDAENKLFKNIFIVGNGAVEGGEEPLKKWLEKRKNRTYGDYIEWEQQLATLAMHRRVIRSLSEEQKSQFDEEQIELVDKELTSLADEYSKSKITRRKLPRHLLNILSSPSTLVLCLNWDTTLWKYDLNIFQMHGTILSPKSMILPTEFALDPTNVDDRPDEVREDLKIAHYRALEALDKVENLYLWGTALNTYDSEIMAFLAQAEKNTEKKLWIINPDTKPGQRAAAILQLKEFFHINPLIPNCFVKHQLNCAPLST